MNCPLTPTDKIGGAPVQKKKALTRLKAKSGVLNFTTFGEINIPTKHNLHGVTIP